MFDPCVPKCQKEAEESIFLCNVNGQPLGISSPSLIFSWVGHTKMLGIILSFNSSTSFTAYKLRLSWIHNFKLLMNGHNSINESWVTVNKMSRIKSSFLRYLPLFGPFRQSRAAVEPKLSLHKIHPSADIHIAIPQSPTSVVLTDQKRTAQILRGKTLRVLRQS